MATLEELRQKKIEELKKRKETSSISDARTEAVERWKNRGSSFIEPQEKSLIDPPEESTAGEAFRRSAAVNTLPMAAGFLTGAKAGALGGSVLPGWGTAIGFIGGGITGALIAKKAQDEVLEVVKGEEWKRNLDQSLAEDRKNHPYATLLGEAAPSLISFRPSPTTLKQAFNLSKRALTDPKSLSKHAQTLEGKTEVDALMNVAIGSGVDISMETYQQAREGDFNALRLIGSAVIGGVISDPNRVGLKLGFKPSGDAVIEEYNEFGSKTEAARIITHGDIPVVDRSTDFLVRQRRELSAILRGESELNRFTEPRILQAERIAGTIDKDVTPDSNLNVYRLDGRSGPMRVGERVTANPFIADVYGGRINPEGTVKAGDLVRTSQGDYIYIPKEEIEARPKLPPVSANVDKNIREQVTTREKLDFKALKIKGKEAVRVKEEPIRRAKEAEEKAAREKADAEARYEKEVKENQARAIKLQEHITKAEAEAQKKINLEKTRVKTEKAAVDKNKDKELSSIDKIKQKALNEARLKHVDRLSKLNTPKQKVKEGIRFGNENARIRAKAIKDKKEIRSKAKAEKDNVKDKSKEIISERDKDIKRVKDRIKELKKPTPKPKSETVSKSKSNKVQGKETTKDKVVSKPEAKAKEKKTTLIGTKKVDSESLIKNAVQEARENSKIAQELDQDVTYQMGTTFVEQRKIATEILVERGFEDTLKFANEASDVEINKLGVDRSALYEALYKTAIKEGEFITYRDELEELALLVSDEVSIAAQKSSLHRLATQNDPFRRVNAIRKTLIETEKKARGSVFTKEVDDLYAKLNDATSLEDINLIIKDNLC